MMRFKDIIDLKCSAATTEFKDFVSSTQPYFCKVIATHAGRTTRNNTIYLPHKMRNSASSFVEHYGKPFLVHHNESKDPIGRIIESVYVDTSNAALNILKNKKAGALDKQTYRDFVQGTIKENNFYTDIVRDYFINDSALEDDPDYKGLGYIELTVAFTDPDAIQKIKDGRYLTVSVGLSTDSAICSKCNRDWSSEDGPCEHRPGKIYDGTKMKLILGDLQYEECSFVNTPADIHAKVISNTNNFQQLNSMEEKDMLLKRVIDLAKANTDLSLLDNIENKINELLPEIKDEMSDQEITDILVSKLISIRDEVKEQESIKETDPVKLFWGSEYDELLGDDSWGRAHLESIMLINDKDAKLTPAQRKALPKSVFCKPPDGYPVDTCARAKAAWAYANKYNESPEVKECIKRKASRLGCPIGEDETQQPKYNEFAEVGYFDIYTDEQLINLLNALLSAIEERKLDISDCTCKKQNEQLDAALKEINEKNNAYKKEINYLNNDMNAMLAQISDLTQQLKNAKIEQLTLLDKLSGKESKYDDKNINDIDILIKDAVNQIDLQKLTSILSLGLTKKEIDVVVEDPTLKQNNIQSNQIDGHIPANQIPEEIKKYLRYTYLDINRFKGKEVADAWLEQNCKVYRVNKLDIISDII